MNIETVTVDGFNKMIVTGLIKSAEDSAVFKDAMTKLLDTQSKTLSIHIQDSFIVTSSIIGSLLKVVNVDKAKITLFVTEDLYSLLQQLNLIEMLNVRKA